MVPKQKGRFVRNVARRILWSIRKGAYVVPIVDILSVVPKNVFFIRVNSRREDFVPLFFLPISMEYFVIL